MMIVDHAGVTLNNLTKSYGSQKVLHEVSFSLNPGQITGLLGENGAGKSTLAKILAGATTPDTGSILIGNKHVSLQTPRESLAHGISFIPQELIYVPRLTVAENICLGRWPRKGFVTSPTQMKTFAESEVNRLGFDLPLQSEMNSLSFAQQQTVEIVKALSRDSKLIILDEPTAALNNDESAQLLSIMGNMALSGASILYISHRLD
ncbi:MAG: ATP-binding cassette domain-containing protein, partial [Actinobacteria bacterium]|nr:ATP-binding cassette domain-containing protein [Actinomycetota bacterium]